MHNMDPPLRVLRAFRPTVAWAMVVAVLLTSIHCARHAAESFAVATRMVESHGPNGPQREAPTPCEQESGCLCRGAVLAKSVELPCLLGAGKWIRELALTLAPDFSIVIATIATTASGNAGFDDPPSISGRALRAWVNSLQC